MGMARRVRAGGGGRVRVPHACGDGPRRPTSIVFLRGSSPRLWGWPAVLLIFRRLVGEFPTPVGMARRSRPPSRTPPGVPHACGDGPPGIGPEVGQDRSSPRLWGWPAGWSGREPPGTEFPTPVGMARRARRGGRLPCRVPHACGDGPYADLGAVWDAASSPRLWGWPDSRAGQRLHPAEFPTPVGMARSARTDAGAGRPGSSPRLWGWPGGRDVRGHDHAEFPTPVGMARP